jgi:hypothetical protein
VGSGNQAQRPSSTSGNSAQQLLNYLLAP